MKDMISHRTLAHSILRKRRKTIIIIFRFIGGKKMLKMMSDSNVVRSDNILIKVWKVLGDRGIE